MTDSNGIAGGVGLLPCPFCGNDGQGPIEDALHVCHIEDDQHVAYDCYCVQCDQCTATMGYSDSEEEAIAAWNTRLAAPAEVDARVEAAFKAGWDRCWCRDPDAVAAMDGGRQVAWEAFARAALSAQPTGGK